MKTLPKAITGLLITGLLSTAIFSTPVFAKGGDHHGKRGPNIERIAEKLELSEAQTVSFTAIMEAQREQRQSLKDQELTREEKKEQMQAIKADTAESLQSILSEEQLAKIQDMMERGKKHRHGKKGDKADTTS